MTLNGAIMQLVELHEHSMMPVFFKPALANVIDTISELEEPTQTNAEATQDFGRDTNAPSNDCISRQAAIDSMCELMRHWFGCDPKDEIREIKRELGKLPTIEPEQPQRMQGRWIKDSLCTTSGGTYAVRRCSLCESYYHDVVFTWNYCPNCGARMK